MLATIGFLLTGLCFGLFAYTFETLVIEKTKLKLKQFSYAFYCLALAMLIWSVAASIGSFEALRHSVYVGEALLLVGTIFMLDILLGPKRRYWLFVAIALGIVLLILRVQHFTPTPYMRGEILIFNTQIAVGAVIGLLFALVWLPASLHVAKKVTHKIGQDSIASIYSSIYVAATFAALIFIAARRTVTVVLSFIAVGICFLLLIRSNILVAQLLEKHHGK